MQPSLRRLHSNWLVITQHGDMQPQIATLQNVIKTRTSASVKMQDSGKLTTYRSSGSEQNCLRIHWVSVAARLHLQLSHTPADSTAPATCLAEQLCGHAIRPHKVSVQKDWQEYVSWPASLCTSATCCAADDNAHKHHFEMKCQHLPQRSRSCEC
jgi:hypothetical protein